MELKRITCRKAAETQRLIALHGETFPEYERFQESPLLANLIEIAPDMHFNAIYENNELAGFFMYWDLEDSYYIHFISVFPEMRNRKIGQQLLEWVSSNLHKPVFLETDIPYNEITERRLSFYKRNGFLELANDPKILSNERRGGPPLWLMANQPVDCLDNYLIKIRDRVYFAAGGE